MQADTSPNPDAVITAEAAGKRFFLRQGARSVKSAALDLLRGRRARRELWALKDVTFSVSAGETLGIIGANGAGKSTLLSLLAGTRTPTEGSVRTRGVVSSLLELGAGFHPDLSGRENVFLYGTIMGLSRAQMKQRFDAIVSFSGLDDFIDEPVKHYSSGMYVRLGFSVAVEVDPDILLIDEVLAVGDVDFQRRCLDRMADFRERGKTMLIISHDLPTIMSISDRILFLEQGRIRGLGDPESMVDTYRSAAARRETEGLAREWGTGEARIAGVTFYDAGGRETDVFRAGSAMEVRIAYQADRRIAEPVFGFAIHHKNGDLVYGNNTQVEGLAVPFIEGRGALRLAIPRLDLAAGAWLFSFSLHSADHRTNYHRLDRCYTVTVENERGFEGCYLPVRWSVERKD